MQCILQQNFAFKPLCFHVTLIFDSAELLPKSDKNFGCTFLANCPRCSMKVAKIIPEQVPRRRWVRHC